LAELIAGAVYMNIVYGFDRAHSLVCWNCELPDTGGRVDLIQKKFYKKGKFRMRPV